MKMQICCLPGVMVNPLLHTQHAESPRHSTPPFDQAKSFSGLPLGLSPGGHGGPSCEGDGIPCAAKP